MAGWHNVIMMVVAFRAHCTNVVHDLGSAEPRSKVHIKLCCTKLNSDQLILFS